MNKKWLIDTDIFVDLLRGCVEAIEFFEEVMHQSECFISPIIIAELYGGVREGNERRQLDLFMKEFQVTALDENIAQMGGLFRRDYGKSHNVGLADALIAATANHYHLTLATLNKKHYPMIQKIHVPYLKHSESKQR
jgi:predicted nucleic acid-binding protein